MWNCSIIYNISGTWGRTWLIIITSGKIGPLLDIGLSQGSHNRPVVRYPPPPHSRDPNQNVAPSFRKHTYNAFSSP